MSIRARLFLTHAAVIVVGLVIPFVALLLLLVSVQTRQSQRDLATTANATLRLTGAIDLQEDLPKLQNRLRRTGRDLRVLVLDGSGNVIEDIGGPDVAQTMRSFKGKRLSVSESLLAPAALRNTTAIGEFNDGNRAWLYGATRLPEGSEATWLAFARVRPTRLTLDALEEIWRPILIGFLVALLISALVAALVARTIARPIQQVAAAATAIAQGNYERRMLVSGPAEIRELADDFNHMAAQVQAARQTERDFVINVSHELKTPLTSIQGFAQAMTDGAISDSEGMKRAAQVIQTEADRLRRMAVGLLDSARLESGELKLAHEPVHMNEIAQACVERLMLRARENQLTLLTDFGTLPVISGDGDRLAQVITNLIDNAIKYTPANGKITVQTRMLNNAGGVTLTVSDTGRGIPEEDLTRVFERFYQVDKSRANPQASSSSGLGLAICKQLVEAHGGTIGAQSVLGIGTRMVVWLPGQHH